MARLREDVAEWPRDGLEEVSSCPVCGSGKRELLYDGLTDRIWFVAPGTWTLHQCTRCRSVFLDPRPTRDSLELAYRSYYTHGDPAPVSQLRARSLRTALVNGYLNARYGYRLSPASRLGPLVAALLPTRGWHVDHSVRHLGLEPGRNRLLDVGCGDGAFLAGMRNAGWDVTGVEPDEAAADRARANGLRVISSALEDADLEPASFDALTMNHVIEHLHDPIEALRICRRLLRPGGTLWLATPNLDARGHAVFGSSWIGLDPPRHLVLFTRDSLVGAVEAAGFAVRRLPAARMAGSMFGPSAAVAAGAEQPILTPPTPSTTLRRLTADFLVRFRPERAEEIVVIAEAVE